MRHDLVASAMAAREHARAAYSGFKVGAAIRTQDGAIFSGCNIENATLGLTVCAERVALWKALSEGADSFTEIVIATDSDNGGPCGACRQLLWEYCGDIAVRFHSIAGRDQMFRLSELLPHPFDANSLG
nr:cytidine deaminase [uncultured bacterium]